MALLVKSFAILCVHAPSVKSYTPGTHCGSNLAFSLTWPASIQICWNNDVKMPLVKLSDINW